MSVSYGYGLNIIESVSVESGITYRIKFYQAISPDRVGISESHGLTYAEARAAYKKGFKEPFGLELKIMEVD